jgi:hypothetical protein
MAPMNFEQHKSTKLGAHKERELRNVMYDTLKKISSNIINEDHAEETMDLNSSMGN